MVPSSIYRYTLWAVALLAPMVPASSQTGETLRAEKLQPLFAGSSSTWAVDINDEGLIVGSSTDSAGHARATRWNKQGKPKGLHCPQESVFCRAVAINNSGGVVGNVETDSNFDLKRLAVVWGSDGKARSLSIPSGMDYSDASDIDDRGFVVGSTNAYEFGSEGGPATAIFWRRNGEPSSNLQPLVGVIGAADSSVAKALNDNKRSPRMVVGDSFFSFGEGNMATVWDREGKATALPPLRAQTYSSAQSVNRSGTVVGTSHLVTTTGNAISGDTATAVVWGDDGQPVALELLPGCAQSEASDINDAGFVVGTASFCSARKSTVPVVWNPEGEVFELPLPTKYVEGYALAINKWGDIVGQASRRNGKTVAIVWR